MIGIPFHSSSGVPEGSGNASAVGVAGEGVKVGVDVCVASVVRVALGVRVTVEEG
jgi:hypothetical protein